MDIDKTIWYLENAKWLKKELLPYDVWYRVIGFNSNIHGELTKDLPRFGNRFILIDIWTGKRFDAYMNTKQFQISSLTTLYDSYPDTKIGGIIGCAINPENKGEVLVNFKFTDEKAKKLITELKRQKETKKFKILEKELKQKDIENKFYLLKKNLKEESEILKQERAYTNAIEVYASLLKEKIKESKDGQISVKIEDFAQNTGVEYENYTDFYSVIRKGMALYGIKSDFESKDSGEMLIFSLLPEKIETKEINNADMVKLINDRKERFSIINSGLQNVQQNVADAESDEILNIEYIKSLLDKIKELEEKIKELGEENSRQEKQELLDKIKELEEKIKELGEENSKERREKQELLDKIKELEEKIKELGEDNGKFSKDLLIDKIKDLVYAINSDLKDQSKKQDLKIQQLEDKNSRLTEELNKIVQREQKLNDDARNLEERRRKVEQDEQKNQLTEEWIREHEHKIYDKIANPKEHGFRVVVARLTNLENAKEIQKKLNSIGEDSEIQEVVLQPVKRNV